MKNEIITTVKAAKELTASVQTVRDWIALGKIDPKGCFQVGGRGQWRIYRWALEKAKHFAK